MWKPDRWSGFFWLILSVFGSYESYKLGLGTVQEPGPGFLFFWTGAIVAILSLTVILNSSRKLPSGEREEGKEFISRRRAITKTILVLVSLFLYAFLMEWAGFLVVTLLFFTFLLGAIEKKGWSFAVLVSLIVTAMSYLIFETALQSHLPKGLLDFLRF